jgi:hypothetical protein
VHITVSSVTGIAASGISAPTNTTSSAKLMALELS